MRIAVLAHNLRDTGGLSVGKNIVHLLPKIAPQHYYLFLIPIGTGYEIRKDSTRVNYIEIPEISLKKMDDIWNLILLMKVER